MSKEHRKQVDKQFREYALGLVKHKMEMRLKHRGEVTFSSQHEILGIITEEFHELVEAVRNNDRSELIEELLDVAVGCVFGLACICADTTDW